VTATAPTPAQAQLAQAASGLQRAEAEDPFGHTLHTVFFLGWAACVPLGMIPWAKDVFLGALVVWSILRITIGGVGCGWAGLHQRPLVIVMLAWMLWSALSISWSPDPSWGADQLKGLRAMVVPFAAWPVLRHWRGAFAAFSIGGTVVAAIIVFQSLEWLPNDSGNRAFAYMGQTGLVLATTLAVHIAFTLTQERRRSVVWHLGGACLVMLALPLHGGRGTWLAAIIAAILVVVVLAALVQRLRLRVLLITTVTLAGIAITSTIDTAVLDSAIGDRIAARVELARRELDVNAKDDLWSPANKGSLNYRLKAWNASRHALAASPLIGWGLGGLSKGLADYPGMRGLYSQQPITSQQFDPHSTYLYEATSTGLLGFSFFSIMLAGAVATLAFRIRGAPCAAAAVGLLAAWMVCGIAETVVLSGIGVAILALGLAAACAPRPGP